MAGIAFLELFLGPAVSGVICGGCFEILMFGELQELVPFLIRERGRRRLVHHHKQAVRIQRLQLQRGGIPGARGHGRHGTVKHLIKSRAAAVEKSQVNPGKVLTIFEVRLDCIIGVHLIRLGFDPVFMGGRRGERCGTRSDKKQTGQEHGEHFH